MKVDVKSIDEIRDSRLAYEKNPPPFGYYFIGVITFLLIATIVWSTKAKKTYEVIANGVVTSENTTYVMSEYTGEVINCNIKEGALVNKGDVLFTINNTDLFAKENKSVIKAKASGIIHMNSDIKPGMLIQTTIVLATIKPKNVDNIIEAFVTTADRAKLQEGDEVVITIDGLLQNVYGNIKGKVIQIDSDITNKEVANLNQQGFKLKISMDANYLISSSGDKVDIVNGMTAVSRITYDKITYMDYVLDKLGFKTK